MVHDTESHGGERATESANLGLMSVEEFARDGVEELEGQLLRVALLGQGEKADALQQMNMTEENIKAVQGKTSRQRSEIVK